MKNRRVIILILITFLSLNVLYALNGDKEKNKNISFFVAADLHFDPPPESDQYYHVVAMNKMCGELKNSYSLLWTKEIDNVNTGFDCCGEKINIPKGVILVGDITDRAEPSALELFKTRYEMGEGIKQIHFPVYIGLGNHDLDPKHVEGNENEYRKKICNYVTERHRGKNAPVPVDNFDEKSLNYSWNWEYLHLIQTHRFAGNIENGCANSLEWLKDDLNKYASGGRPVIIFQHYGFDKFSLNWWKDDERNTLAKVLEGYNIIGIFVGHSHFADISEWNGIPVFQVNNAWKDDDGCGSFAICQITENTINVITCRWKDGEGNTEFVAPFYHGKINQK